jgi:ABC-type bacteriocin/lantibiotic exporter with double-glycine peptidase domain
MTVLQGLVTTISVASIFPFLALAADPKTARENSVIAFYMRWVGDLSSRDLIFLAGGLAVASLAVSNLLSLASIYINARFTAGIGYSVKNRLLASIAARDYSYFLDVSPGVVMKKINVDAQNFANQIVAQIFQLITGLCTVAMLMAALLMLNPVVAFTTAICFMGVYGLIFKSLKGVRKRYSDQSLLFTRRTNQLCHQFLSAMKTIKVQQAERTFLDEFNEISSKAAKATVVNRVIGPLPRSIIEPVAIGILVAIVLFSIPASGDASKILPTVGVFAVATYRMLPSLQSIYASATTLTSNLHAVEEVYSELAAPQSRRCQNFEEPVDRIELTSSIHFSAVSFSYGKGTNRVIDNFNATIKLGESVAVVGKTGSGKSTFVDLLLGLHFPCSGEICIDGVKLGHDNVRGWQGSIGYVPQDVVLVDASIAANIALGTTESKIDWPRLKEAARVAQIHDFVETELPEKWSTEVGDRGVRLSGGQRQRIGIARALYRSPSILVLDEATSSLDVDTESCVMEGVKRLKGSITLIIVAHRLSTIDWCSKFIDLDRCLTTSTPAWRNVES